MNPIEDKQKVIEPDANADNGNCCGLCDLTYFDMALDHLGLNWDNPAGLWRAMKGMYEDEYEHYAKPLLWRLEKINPRYPGLPRLRQAINDRIFWGGG